MGHLHDSLRGIYFEGWDKSDEEGDAYEFINELKNKCRDEFLKTLTKNGIDHSKRLEKYMDTLVLGPITSKALTQEEFTNRCQLIPAEVFVLLCAIYLHDIGYVVEGSGNIKQIPEGHPQRSAKYIRKNFKKYLFDRFPSPNPGVPIVAEAVALVCKGHANEHEVKLDKIPTRYGDSALFGKPLNLRRLAALLRLADEADDPYIRGDALGSSRGDITLVEIRTDDILWHWGGGTTASSTPDVELGEKLYNMMVEKTRALKSANDYLSSYGINKDLHLYPDPLIEWVTKSRKPFFDIPALSLSNDFIGRLDQIKKIIGLFEGDTQKVLISGMAGMGKSMLAAMVASQSRDDLFQKGVVTIDMRGQSTTEPADVPGKVMENIASKCDESPETTAKHLKDFGAEVLIILDNAESVDFEVVQDVIDKLAVNSVLITSREKQNPGKGLAVVELEEFTANESRDMFFDICSNKEFTQDELKVIDDICKLCGHLPLAVALAASNISQIGISLDKYRDNLCDSLEGLEDPYAKVYSIETAFSLSWDELKPNQQILFAICSLFGAESFSRDLVLSLAAKMISKKSMSLEKDLNRLIQLSLVRNSNRPTGRHNLHPLLRKFGRDKLVQLELVGLWQTLGEDFKEAIESDENFLTEELDNVISLIDDWDKDKGDWQLVLNIIYRIEGYLNRRGLWETGRQVLAKGIQAASQLKNMEVKADYIFKQGRLYSYQNRYLDALGKYESCINDLPDQTAFRARVLMEIGHIYRKQNDWSNARLYFNKALNISQTISSRDASLVEARCYLALGDIDFELGDIDTAESKIILAEDVLKRVSVNPKERKYLREKADTIHRIGNVYFYKGQLVLDDKIRKQLQIKTKEKYDEAIELLNSIPKSDWDIEDTRLQAFYYDHRAQWYFVTGDLVRAEDDTKQAIHFFKAVGQEDGIAYAKDHLGECFMAKGFRKQSLAEIVREDKKEELLKSSEKFYTEARTLFDAALAKFVKLEKLDGQAWLLHHLGEAEENLSGIYAALNKDHKKRNEYLESSKKHYEKAIDLFTLLNNLKEVNHIRKHINDVTLKQFGEKECQNVIKEYQDIIDSFFDKDVYKKLYTANDLAGDVG